nr:MAG TPA: hypothetical protein [Caudoviricetes sp.]
MPRQPSVCLAIKVKGRQKIWQYQPVSNTSKLEILSW